MFRTHTKLFGRVAGALTLITALGLTGCDLDELLEVDDPDVVSPGTLEDPELLPVVVAGAQNDFTGAFSGGESYLTVSALITDEFYSAGTFTTRTATDRREQFPTADGNTSDGTYNDLQFARRALRDAAAKVSTIRGTDHEDYADLKTKEGYTKVLLAEGWCSNIPLSFVDASGEFQFTPGFTGAAVLDSAIVNFDQVLSAQPGSDFAKVGKGRALLDLGRYDAAAAAVSGVETEFVYLIFHSVSGISNGIFTQQNNGRYSVSDTVQGPIDGLLTGSQGFPFRTADDPRSPVTFAGAGFDDQIALFLSDKHTDYATPVVIASGVEARLIQAEAELNNGNFIAMNLILNDLRAQADVLVPLHVRGDAPEDAQLDPLPIPLSRDQAIDQLFDERAFWLYLTGHRLGDSRRLMYQYGRAEDDVYPSGNYFKGGEFGNDVVFPVDFDEGNNDLYDADQCVVTDAGIQ